MEPGAGGDEDHAQSVVLEEEIDENYEPTEEEILEYAGWLGMNLEKEKDLLWIASEGLKAPLPEDWKPCRSPEGDIYYFNFTTGESVWDHPCDEYYRKLYQDEKKKKEEAEAGRRDQSSTSGPVSASSTGVIPVKATTSKVFQAPQKLSALGTIPGLKRKDKEDPFKKGTNVLGQSPSPTKEGKFQSSKTSVSSHSQLSSEARTIGAATTTTASTASTAAAAPPAVLSEEKKAEEAAKDAQLRQEFSAKLESERKDWEKAKEDELAKKKQEMQSDIDAKIEACKKDLDETYAKEKKGVDAKIAGYKRDLDEMYVKEESVLRKLQQQKLANLERELKEKQEAKEKEGEEKLNARILTLQAEHEEKVAALKSENESTLKQLDDDLKAVSKTCSKKIEDMVEDKEEKERKLREEISALESEHQKRLEEKKKEIEEDFEAKIQAITSANELWLKNSQVVQSTFAEEQMKLEEVVKKKVEDERKKNESFLEEECEKLKADREHRLKEEQEKHELMIKEELARLEKENAQKIKEMQSDNEKYLSKELENLRASRAEQIAEDRVEQEDTFKQIQLNYEEKERKAEEDAQKRLKEKFEELEKEYFLEVEGKEKELKEDSKLKVDTMRRELEKYESECQEEVELQKRTTLEEMQKEVEAEVEAQRAKCLQTLESELEEFKNQKRAELKAKAESEVMQERQISTDTSSESQDESEEGEETVTRRLAVESPRELPEPTSSLSNMDEVISNSRRSSGDANDLLLGFLKEQKHFLQQRQSALQKAREDWKIHMKSLKEQKENGMIPSSSEDVALATAKYTLEAQSRMLNEDTRNYRALKREIEKNISNDSRGMGKENQATPSFSEENLPNWPTSRARARDSLKSMDTSHKNNFEPARTYVKGMNSRKMAYEKATQDRKHADALEILNGHSKWLTSFKSKICSTLAKTGHNQKLASALHKVRSSEREVVIRISR